MISPRNKIVCNLSNEDQLVYVDTLYELADAEINSFKHVHEHFNDLKRKFVKFDGKFAQYLHSEVYKVAQRNDMVHLVSWYMCEVVAKAVAKEWCKDRSIQWRYNFCN